MIKYIITIFLFITLITSGASLAASAQKNEANQGISQSNNNDQKGDSNTSSQTNVNTGSNTAGQVATGGSDSSSKDKTDTSSKDKTTKDTTYVPPSKDKKKEDNKSNDKDV